MSASVTPALSAAVPPSPALVERRFVPANVAEAGYDAGGFGPVELLAESLPAPEELGAGERLVITSGATPRSGLLGRFRRPVFVHAAVRGAALLARGYVDIGGTGGGDGDSDDLVWGVAPTHLARVR